MPSSRPAGRVDIAEFTTSRTTFAMAAATTISTSATTIRGRNAMMSLSSWLTGFDSPNTPNASWSAISRMK